MELTPESQALRQPKFKLNFFGNGSTYFGIVILNLLLTLITLGIYYPWAKAAYRKYIWNEVEMKGSRFAFHGTGREMLIGFLIAYALILGFYGVSYLAETYDWAGYLILVFYLLFLMFLPLAIYGSWRYRMTRTSWRGVFFQFDGNFREFVKLYIPAILLTIVTFGIYGAWMRVKLMKYLFSHTKLGDLRMDFKGDGGDLFGINIAGGILTAITFYLYLPIWIKERFKFTINNTTISDGVTEKRLNSTLENGEAWGTMFTNTLLLVVTLGLAFPWTFIRTMRMFFNNVEVPNDFDFDNLEQTEQVQSGAVGDQITDIFDLDFGF